MEKLGKLKNNDPALNGGKHAASYTRLKTSDEKKVLAFKREKDGSQVYYIANFTDKPVSFKVDLDGEF